MARQYEIYILPQLHRPVKFSEYDHVPKKTFLDHFDVVRRKRAGVDSSVTKLVANPFSSRSFFMRIPPSVSGNRAKTAY